MRVPHDTGNLIPEVGWRVYERLWDEGSQDFVYVLVELVPDAAEPDEDEESPPGTPGDNLTVFEEFRGFMIRGVHYRTSPSVKDVFLYSYVLGSSLDDAASIAGLKWHTPFQSEISASRRINANAAGIPGHQDQQAILMFNQPVSGGNANEVGSVPCSPNLPFVCYPNVIGYTKASYPNYEDWDPLFNVQIHESVIRAAAPDAVEAEAIRAVIGHELGHAINIFHNQDQASIMKEAFETLNDWNNLTHVFLVPSDTSQIRVK